MQSSGQGNSEKKLKKQETSPQKKPPGLPSKYPLSLKKQFAGQSEFLKNQIKARTYFDM